MPSPVRRNADTNDAQPATEPDGTPSDAPTCTEAKAPSPEEIAFHWEKWKTQAKSFWGRSVAAIAVLLVSIAFQFSVVKIKDPWISLEIPKHPKGFYLFLNASSWFLLLFLCFSFIDLLRHRVPEHLEETVHNNSLPNPLNRWHIGGTKVPLKPIGQVSYLIFPAYVGLLAYLLTIAFVRILVGSLP